MVIVSDGGYCAPSGSTPKETQRWPTVLQLSHPVCKGDRGQPEGMNAMYWVSMLHGRQL